MSVTLYNANNPHPAGFIGYRVAVMVASFPKQRYFSIAKGGKMSQHRLANKLNARWLSEQEKGTSYRNNEAMPTARAVNSTGVKGIQKIIDKDKYIVQGSHNKKPFYKTFLITEKGWIAAVTFLAKSKHLTRWRHLIKRGEWNVT